MVPCVGLRCMIVVFPDLTHLLFLIPLYSTIQIDFCIWDWYDKGTILVSDIIDENEKSYQFEALKTNYKDL